MGMGAPGGPGRMGPPMIGPQGGPGKMGPSYKTSICKSWAESGNCQYGGSCLFAHGEGEKRSEGQQYKTSLCKNWESSGMVVKIMKCCRINASFWFEGLLN